MSSTYATVILAAEDREQASADLEDANLFTIPLSESGQEPATHYAASGWFLNDQLDYIANQEIWPRTVRFGDDLDAHLTDAGLQQIVVTEP